MKRFAFIAIALGAVTHAAHAGGLERPNGISARGTGLGGAFTAFADDPTAIWFNPAALDATEPQVMIGGELVYGPREYTPVAADGTRGAKQEATIISPVPSLGVVGRFDYDDRPSRFTLGFGVWNTFGGEAAFPKTGMPALDTTRDIAIEADGAAALHISDRLAVGGTFRLGIGLFKVESTMKPFDSDISASGVGVAMAWGALFKATDDIRIGLTWRSPLRVTTKGSGTIVFGGPAERHDVRHRQNWPQQVSLGVGWQTSPRLKLAAQLDWTQWSQIDKITVEFPASALPTQIYPEYWDDSWTARVGGEYALSPALALRAGTYFDTTAVPDRTIERQYLDSNKLGLSAGTTLRAAGWRFDAALDGIIPTTRTVENNATDVMGFTPLVNTAPGDYRGTLITFELSAARPF
ncbi:MAG TPA: outer membrane protein transport protein [Kofleriaceae bacterium]|nr:outer membrane protein transport protein [Kofleriaceae bacterium]